MLFHVSVHIVANDWSMNPLFKVVVSRMERKRSEQERVGLRGFPRNEKIFEAWTSVLIVQSKARILYN